MMAEMSRFLVDLEREREREERKIVTGNGVKRERKRANLNSKYLDCRIDGIDTWSGVYRYQRVTLHRRGTKGGEKGGKDRG